MLASGCCVRRSSATQTARTTRPARDQAERLRRAPAPDVGLRDRRSAAARGRRRARRRRGRRRGPGVRIGDSGTKQLGGDRAASAHDRADPEDPVVGGVVDEQRRRSTRPERRRRCRRSPRSGRCCRATRSRGNSSRMIPKQSGKMPPPTPCRTRPATTIPSVVAERRDDRAGGEDAAARSRAAGACRTCRRAGRRAACATAAASR